MRLIDNWQRTLTHGYASWAIYAAGAVHFAQECLPYVSETIPWWGSIAILAAGLVLRLVKQQSISGDDDEQA